ncbi:sensor domain-containing phosphodiesterase [Sphingomonas glaciei]|uniref:EAL domain-containing protein n=1 Tax=Sphingomonas glaciei TaxID=2938948 RepID=A0ABY5MYS4_9SPHN|nr:EAL domain-containing protein [Sphingomonas glaciei]UUR08925.1 EAL domain-containing protein [Sphingomonas glaciei]
MAQSKMRTRSASRTDVLIQHDLLGAFIEADFQELVELGKSYFGVSICAVSIVGERSQCFKGIVGFDAESTPVEIAFCAHTILSDGVMVVLDATQDPRFAANPLVIGVPGIRFYAGAPITTKEGERVGAYCIIDSRPRRSFSSKQRQLLLSLAKLASQRIQRRPEEKPAKVMGSFAEASQLGILTANSAGRITSWNAAATAMFGHEQRVIIGKQLSLIIPERFREAHRQGFQKVARHGGSALAGRAVEVIAQHADGHEFPIELSLAAWHDGYDMCFGAYVQDITARKAREDELQDLAKTDPLTGLMNAKAFRDCLDFHLRSTGKALVLTLDLDGFKGINDSLGHAFGDALLQTLALRLRMIGSEQWRIARLGGDEFALLFRDEPDLFVARDVASEIITEFSRVIPIDGYQLKVGASVGIAFAPDHADNADELLVRADLAMFRAKKEGGRTYRLFDKSMGDELAARKAFRNELKHAGGKRQWELYYQPQYSLEDGRLTGVEALLRWRHPTWGIILPSTFMPVLETHVLAYDVGNWVLDEACRQIAAWRKLGIAVPRVSVNLFSAQVHTGSIADRVNAALERNGLKPSDLELEITETIALRHNDKDLAPLFGLMDQGVGIAFDDFGTGFASLTTLQRFPLTRLKIDRSFVADICTNPQSIAVAGGILAIGRALGVDVIAEGIESKAQEVRLVELGCLEGQGYLYGRAVPPSEFELRNGRRLCA